MKKHTIGIIGLGNRGMEILKNVLLPMGVTVTCLCDIYKDKQTTAADAVCKAGGAAPALYSDYRTLLQIEQPQAVFVATSWQTHFRISIDAMEAGIPVACEVSPAFALSECWELVRTWEKTQTPLMFMENCCYGREELMVQNMVAAGVFGKVVHCDGAYGHDIRQEVGFGKENRHYRLDHYLNRCCENYPTHELGPIAQLLKINRGNRILSVSSFASGSHGMHEYIHGTETADKGLLDRHFAQGDIVTTVLTCAGGETVRLTLDTTLPRPYSRGFTVHGTKALYCEDNLSLFLDGTHNAYDFCWKEQFNNVEQYREQYEHPIWQKFLAEGVQGGHGGMDWLQFEAFFRHLETGVPMPIDVYDMAVWTAVSVLSEESISMGGAPRPMPDFTCGKWMTRE